MLMKKIRCPNPKCRQRILDDEGRLKKEQGRYETLLDMRMNNEIPREMFSRPCRRMGSFRKVI